VRPVDRAHLRVLVDDDVVVAGLRDEDYVFRDSAETTVDLEPNVDIRTGRLDHRVADQVDMVVLQAFPYEFARHAESEDTVGQGDGMDVGEPHHDGRFGKVGAGAFQDMCPGLAHLALRERYRHPYPQNLSTTVENPRGKVIWRRAGR
jgi:hypothetical protein